MTALNHLVFTVIATDRPGLVERLADAIAVSGGNWVDSSMARLGGEFAGIVSVEIPKDRLADLHNHLEALISEGIAITLRSESEKASAPDGTLASLEIMCQDHPGILRDVTHILAAKGVSIENLDTMIQPGSMQGERMFKATAELRLPLSLSPSELSDALEETAGDLMADITLADPA